MQLVQPDGRVLSGADAARAALALRPALRPLAAVLGLPVVRSLSRLGYRAIAANRYRLGGHVEDCGDDACRAHVPAPSRSGPLTAPRALVRDLWLKLLGLVLVLAFGSLLSADRAARRRARHLAGDGVDRGRAARGRPERDHAVAGADALPVDRADRCASAVGRAARRAARGAAAARGLAARDAAGVVGAVSLLRPRRPAVLQLPVGQPAARGHVLEPVRRAARPARRGARRRPRWPARWRCSGCSSA